MLQNCYEYLVKYCQISTLSMALIVYGDSIKAKSCMTRPQMHSADKSSFEAIKASERCTLVQEILVPIDHGFWS